MNPHNEWFNKHGSAAAERKPARCNRRYELALSGSRLLLAACL
jgi:hypothetical protein